MFKIENLGLDIEYPDYLPSYKNSGVLGFIDFKSIINSENQTGSRVYQLANRSPQAKLFDDLISKGHFKGLEIIKEMPIINLNHGKEDYSIPIYYLLDYFIPSKSLAIELDSSLHNEYYDYLRDNYLKTLGIKVYRIDRFDIDTDKKLLKLDKAVEKRQDKPLKMNLNQAYLKFNREIEDLRRNYDPNNDLNPDIIDINRDFKLNGSLGIKATYENVRKIRRIYNVLSLEKRFSKEVSYDIDKNRSLAISSRVICKLYESYFNNEVRTDVNLLDFTLSSYKDKHGVYSVSNKIFTDISSGHILINIRYNFSLLRDLLEMFNFIKDALKLNYIFEMKGYQLYNIKLNKDVYANIAISLGINLISSIEKISLKEDSRTEDDILYGVSRSIKLSSSENDIEGMISRIEVGLVENFGYKSIINMLNNGIED